jgi:large repetitive protein
MRQINRQNQNEVTSVLTESDAIAFSHASTFVPTTPKIAEFEAGPAGDNEIRVHQVRAADPTLNNGRLEVVFIDTGLADYQVLRDGVRAGVEVVLMESGESGLAQMAEWAKTHSGYDAIHVLSHGSEGLIRLGADTISQTSLSDAGVKGDLSTLGRVLTAGGDLLIYGCSVAEGEAGQAFVANLAGATGADVGASTDITGGFTVGGNWNLEKSTGAIEAGLFADRAILDDYGHALTWGGTLTFDGDGGAIGITDASTITYLIGGYTLQGVSTQYSMIADAVGDGNIQFALNAGGGGGFCGSKHPEV